MTDISAVFFSVFLQDSWCFRIHDLKTICQKILTVIPLDPHYGEGIMALDGFWSGTRSERSDPTQIKFDKYRDYRPI